MAMHARLFDANGHDTEIDLAQERVADIPADQLLWVDTDRSPERLRAVAEALSLGDALAALAQPTQRPSVTRGEGLIRIHVLGLGEGEGVVRPAFVDFVAQRNLVVSVHDDDVVGLDAPVREMEGETRLGKLDAGTFLALLLDGLLGAYFEAVERIEVRIDSLDVQALRAGDPDDVLEAMV